MNTFKDVISIRRKDKKLTLRKLSELTGISASYLSEIEHGVKLPPKNPTKIERLAYALDYDLKKLSDLAQAERAKGKMPNILAKLLGQDQELALALYREAENNEEELEELRKIFKEALKSWKARRK